MVKNKKERIKTRSDLYESWTLQDGKKIVSQVIRSPVSGQLQIYLLGSDEPEMVSVTCWEDAKDYVFRWMRRGMPDPTQL